MSKRWHIIRGNARRVLPKRFDADNVDAIVTDPPYELAFMGKSWDKLEGQSNQTKWPYSWATQAIRVLKPGGLGAVAFPIRENFMKFRPTRTEGFYLHELADLEAAFRDAGFKESHTERNDAVRFGCHCIMGLK